MGSQRGQKSAIGTMIILEIWIMWIERLTARNIIRWRNNAQTTLFTYDYTEEKRVMASDLLSKLWKWVRDQSRMRETKCLQQVFWIRSFCKHLQRSISYISPLLCATKLHYSGCSLETLMLPPSAVELSNGCRQMCGVGKLNAKSIPAFNRSCHTWTSITSSFHCRPNSTWLHRQFLAFTRQWWAVRLQTWWCGIVEMARPLEKLFVQWYNDWLFMMSAEDCAQLRIESQCIELLRSLFEKFWNNK